MNIVGRDEWGADPDSLPRNRDGSPRKMRLPAREVWLHHSVTTPTTHPGADMRGIEHIGLSRFGQFSYSYCIHPTGTILEGCGDRVGAHTAGRNSTSFGICLIGNYEERSVKVQQIHAVRWLIAHLIAIGKLKRGAYPTGGHRDVKSTACPGAKAYRLLDAMREPWAGSVPDTPHAPPDTPASVYDYEGAAVKTTLVPINLDGNGNGWARWDPGFNRDPIIVGAVLHGPYPPVDTYWEEDETVTVAAQAREGSAVITARNGRAGDKVHVWVSCA